MNHGRREWVSRKGMHDTSYHLLHTRVQEMCQEALDALDGDALRGWNLQRVPWTPGGGGSKTLRVTVASRAPPSSRALLNEADIVDWIGKRCGAGRKRSEGPMQGCQPGTRSVLFCMPDTTSCVLLVSVMPGASRGLLLKVFMSAGESDLACTGISQTLKP
jgi:hypothetical protein